MAYTKIQRWFFVAIGMALFVILFGSVVRISGSGAGCGQAWPMCGVSVREGAGAENALIESVHRLSSALLALLFVALAVAAQVRLPRAPAVRVFSLVSLALVIVEAVVGMLLVRHAWVGTDPSLAHALTMAFHLANTLLLLGATSASAFFCWPPRHNAPKDRAFATIVALALPAVLVVSASGAVTALGDTVYPTRLQSGLLHWPADLAQSTSFLQQTRALHPLLAIALIASVLGAFSFFRDRTSNAARFLLVTVLVMFLVQAGLGLMSISFSTPAILQLLHLLFACLTWIALVFLVLELWSPRIAAGNDVSDLSYLARNLP